MKIVWLYAYVRGVAGGHILLHDVQATVMGGWMTTTDMTITAPSNEGIVYIGVGKTNG